MGICTYYVHLRSLHHSAFTIEGIQFPSIASAITFLIYAEEVKFGEKGERIEGSRLAWGVAVRITREVVEKGY